MVQYVFGYGSLINSISRSYVTRSNNSFYARINPKFGYIRCWNFCGCNNATSVGLKKSNKIKDSINGVLFEVKNLSKCDQRESGYQRIKLSSQLLEVLGSKKKINSNDIIWIYIPLNNNINKPSNKYPIKKSYVYKCIKGCLEYDKLFAIEFIKSTYNWPKQWLDDDSNNYDINNLLELYLK